MTNKYCFSGGVCAYGPVAMGRDDLWRGVCVRDELCAALPEHRPELRCMWSDLSEWVTGPPEAEVCPDADPRSPFCGGPCGDCPWPERGLNERVGDPADSEVICFGRSDRRAIGACVTTLDRDPVITWDEFDRHCSREQSANVVCLNHHGDLPPEVPDYRLYGGDPCACVVLEDPAHPGTFFEWGFAALADSCARYRELYPGQVECYGDDWTPLP